MQSELSMLTILFLLHILIFTTVLQFSGMSHVSFLCTNIWFKFKFTIVFFLMFWYCWFYKSWYHLSFIFHILRICKSIVLLWRICVERQKTRWFLRSKRMLCCWLCKLKAVSLLTDLLFCTEFVRLFDMDVNLFIRIDYYCQLDY